MGLIITPEEEIKAYFESDDMSQSKLKQLLKGIDAFTAEREDISAKPYIIQGKAVDTILTAEEGEFEKNYYISQSDKKPTEAVENVIQYVYAMVSEDYNEYLSAVVPVNGEDGRYETDEAIVMESDTLEEEVPVTLFVDFVMPLHHYETYIIDGCNHFSYQGRWGTEARMKAICEPGTAYFADICKAYGKTVIDATTNNTIQSIVKSLRTNLRTAKFFDRYEQREYTHVDVILQMPIFFTYRGIKCKALLDMVIVVRDSDGKILLIQPYDLKTMNGNTYDFLGSIKNYRYDIQAVWYTKALADYYAVAEQGGMITPFRFIVESTSRQGKPLVYELSQSMLEIGRNGRPALQYIEDGIFDNSVSTPYINSPKVLGIEQLIDLYLYHEENGWEAEKEILEADKNESLLVVDWNGFVEPSEFLTFNEISTVEFIAE